MTTATPARYLSAGQVAAIVGIRVETVIDRIKRGDLEADRFGRLYRITPEALESYLQSNRPPRPGHIAPLDPAAKAVIQRVIDQAPPLSPDVLHDLRVLLNPESAR
jgi:excisionase family DNA binding protein